MDHTRPRTVGVVRTPAFPSQVGVHGMTVSEHELTPIYARGLSGAANRPWLSAEQLGRRLASIYHGQKAVLRKPWEDPGGAGTTGLFDRSMGGDRVGKGSRGKGLPYVRSRGDAALDPALGRYGYRTVSGYELWRVDPNEAILNGCTGPHLLLPRSEAVSRKMDRLLSSGRGLTRTIPREKDPDAWMQYTPEKALSGGSRSTTFSVVFNLNRPTQIYHLLTPEEREEAYNTMQQAMLASRSASAASSPAIGGGSWKGGKVGSPLLSSRSPVQTARDSGGRSPLQMARDGPHSGGEGREASPRATATNGARSDATASPVYPKMAQISARKRGSFSNSKQMQIPKEDLGEQVYMSLIEFNREWGRLRGDAFAGHLEPEGSLVEAFVDERNRKQALAAERSRVAKERELEIVEKLRNRAVHELNEAVEATSRAEKERSEFERAQTVLDAEKEELQKIIADAEKDGHVDVEEQMMIDRLEFEVRVADQRLTKEKREYEEWAQMAQKELEEAAQMAHRVQAEVTRRLEVENLVKKRLGDNKAAACFSVLDRLEVHAINNKIDLPELTFFQHEQGEEWLCEAQMSDGSGYVGGWKNGHPDGEGIEMLPASKYVGQFKNDMRHGIGSFSLLKSPCAYVGKWVNGVREGLGIACNLRPDGSAVPVVYCVCKNNELVVAERWNESIKSHKAILHEYQGAIKSSTMSTQGAVERFREMHNSSGQDSSGDLFGNPGRDPSEALHEETITRVSSNPSHHSPANRLGNVMNMLGRVARKHHGKARWRESQERDEEVMLDEEGFSMMELARKAAHCKDTEKTLMEQEQAENDRIQKMQHVVDHLSLFEMARPKASKGETDGGKLKAILSLSALLRPSSHNRLASPELAPRQPGSGGGNTVPPLSDDGANGSMEGSRPEESNEDKLKQKQKRHANPLLRMLLSTGAGPKHEPEPEYSRPKSTIGMWVAAGFRVANKAHHSEPHPDDIKAVEAIHLERSKVDDSQNGESEEPEKSAAGGKSQADPREHVLQQPSSKQSSFDSNSSSFTDKKAKKRPIALSQVDETNPKTIPGNNFPEQPASTDVEDYQLMERPISRAGSTRQNSIQDLGGASPFGSRKIDLLGRGAEGSTSSVSINQIAPFKDDGVGISRLDSRQSINSQASEAGPVESWGFAT